MLSMPEIWTENPEPQIYRWMRHPWFRVDVNSASSVCASSTPFVLYRYKLGAPTPIFGDLNHESTFLNWQFLCSILNAWDFTWCTDVNTASISYFHITQSLAHRLLVLPRLHIQLLVGQPMRTSGPPAVTRSFVNTVSIWLVHRLQSGLPGFF